MSDVDQMIEHDWFGYSWLVVCRDCGVVRRRDGRNKPCRGRVKVEMRTAPESQS